MSVEIMESELTEESYQVSFTIAGYVAKQILKKISCDVCKNKPMHGNGHGSEYLDILNRGGSTYPFQDLADFVAHGLILFA